MNLGAILQMRAIPLTLILAAAVFASPESSYHVTQKVPISGEAIRNDIVFDPVTKRIFVSLNKEIKVLDKTGKLVGVIPGDPGISGITIAPELNRGFIWNEHVGSFIIFDVRTLATIKHVEAEHTRSVFYDAFSKQIFIFGFNGKTLVLKGETADKIGELDLKGHPESAVSDGKGAIFVNLQNEGTIAKVAVKTLEVSSRIPVDQCQTTRGIAYDSANEVLFVGCNVGSLAVVNVVTGNVLARSIACSGVGAIFFDREEKALFLSCSEGVISVIRRLSPYSYYLAETVKTEIGAGKMAFDPISKQIFVPEATFVYSLDPDDRELKRGIKPGTMHVLFFQP